MSTQITLPGGGTPFEGTDYIYVYGNKTPNENLVDLQAAINKAADDYYNHGGNRKCILIGPGEYNNVDKDSLEIDLNACYLQSLTGEKDVKITRNNNGLERSHTAFNFIESDAMASLNNGYRKGIDAIQYEQRQAYQFGDVGFGNINNNTKSLLLYGSDLVGYAITNYDNTKIFRINYDGTYFYGPELNTTIQNIFVVNDNIYVQGFSGLYGYKLFKIDPVTLDVDLVSFSPVLVNGYITSLIQPLGVGTPLYIGGNFNNVGGWARLNLAKLNSTGSVDGTFGTTTNSPIETICYDITNDRLSIGGYFSQVNFSPRTYFAFLHPITGDDITALINPGISFDGGVTNIYLDDTHSYLVFGYFTSVNGNYSPLSAFLDPNMLFINNLFNGLSIPYRSFSNNKLYAQNTTYLPFSIGGTNIPAGSFFILNHQTQTVDWVDPKPTFKETLSNGYLVPFFYIIDDLFLSPTSLKSVDSPLIKLIGSSQSGLYSLVGINANFSDGCVSVEDYQYASFLNVTANVFGSNEVGGYIEYSILNINLDNCYIPLFSFAGALQASNSTIEEFSASTEILYGGKHNSFFNILADNCIFRGTLSQGFIGLDLQVDIKNSFLENSFCDFNQQPRLPSNILILTIKNCELIGSFLGTYIHSLDLVDSKLTDSFSTSSAPSQYPEYFVYYNLDINVLNCVFEGVTFYVNNQNGDTSLLDLNAENSISRLHFENIICKDAFPSFQLFIGNNPRGVNFNNIKGTNAASSAITLDIQFYSNSTALALFKFDFINCEIPNYVDNAFNLTVRHIDNTIIRGVSFEMMTFLNCNILGGATNSFFLGTAGVFDTSYSRIYFENCFVNTGSSTAFMSGISNNNTNFNLINFKNCHSEANISFLSGNFIEEDLGISDISFLNCSAKHIGFLADISGNTVSDASNIEFINCSAYDGFLRFQNFTNVVATINAFNCKASDNSYGKNCQELQGVINNCIGPINSFGDAYFDGTDYICTLKGSIKYCDTGTGAFGTNIFPTLIGGGVCQFNSTNGVYSQVSWAQENYNS